MRGTQRKECLLLFELEVVVMLFSVSSILFPSLNSNLDGISIDIFFRGCSRLCPGCHNKELQEFVEPTVSEEHIVESLKQHRNKYSVITLMGGEPMDIHKEKLMLLLQILHREFPEKKLSIYTSVDFKNVDAEILQLLDYIKCGFYDETNRTPTGEFLASKNQIMYKKEEGKWNIQYSYNY